MIGLYGATCNNMYVFAKALSKTDIPIKLILDRKDNFPHSQPVWEDVDLFFKSGFDFRAINWDDFEKEHNWQKPSYYAIPRSVNDAQSQIFKASTGNILTRFVASRYFNFMKEAIGVLEEMQKCKFLIVCGTEASILAMLSGVPYMIFPHGSDMRLAIGSSPKPGWKGALIEGLCVKAFKSAECVASQLPDASAEVPLSEYKRFQKLIVERVPLPYESKERLSQQDRRARLETLFQELEYELPQATHYCFVPSRINFHWKGHDRLLEAIREAGERNNIHFALLGWGDDYQEAMDYVKKFKLEKFVTVLPIFCSKGFLYRFFEATDFILDELNGSGSYGTSLSEAMSRGCPLVSWIGDMFDKPGWEAPPVIHARTKDELKDFILRLSNGEIDLDTQSKKSVAWFKRVHSEESVIAVLKEKFSHFWEA